MTCYFKGNNSVYVISENDPILLLKDAKTAVVEKKKFCWKIFSIENDLKLSKETHSLIHNSQIYKNYCDLCRSRLRFVTKGCISCSFKSDYECKTSYFNPKNLISTLKKHGFYEVDKEMFKRELLQIKNKNKNKTHEIN